MIMRTEVWETIGELGLPGSAFKMLTHLVSKKQKPGGVIEDSQQDLAEELGMHPNVVSRAMRSLTAANVVLRPGRYTYRLHPFVAGYQNETEMNEAIAQALEDIENGELQMISVPRKRHLAAVS
ncbi:helix-turn-helix domain-containing protein [Kitasatospora aureofaciens]|uniref:helix-turn-helix domain-containing protein n=1 Tax=Kitasatospora TaxID=2063 RepID=UPI00340ABC0B